MFVAPSAQPCTYRTAAAYIAGSVRGSAYFMPRSTDRPRRGTGRNPIREHDIIVQ